MARPAEGVARQVLEETACAPARSGAGTFDLFDLRQGNPARFDPVWRAARRNGARAARDGLQR